MCKGKEIDIKAPGPSWWKSYGKGPGSGPGAIGKITGRNKMCFGDGQGPGPGGRRYIMLDWLRWKLDIRNHDASCPFHKLLTTLGMKA